MSPYLLTYVLVTASVLLAAGLCGGRAERAASLICAAGIGLSILTRAPREMRYHHIDPGLLAVDLLVLVGFAIVAVRSARPWAYGAAAVQGVAALSHLSKALNPHLWPAGYAIMETFSIWPILVLLAAGTISWRYRLRTAARTSRRSST